MYIFSGILSDFIMKYKIEMILKWFHTYWID